MNKSTVYFCPQCLHHLYHHDGAFWCAECQQRIERDDALYSEDGTRPGELREEE